MASIFSKIIDGKIPCYKIAENNFAFAFLDINPLQKGHTLVVPKVETDELFELQESHYTELLIFSKKIAAAIKKTIPCNRVGMSVIGLEVPHAHIHLIPIDSESDMNFSRQKLELTAEEFQEIARKINSAL